MQLKRRDSLDRAFYQTKKKTEIFISSLRRPLERRTRKDTLCMGDVSKAAIYRTWNRPTVASYKHRIRAEMQHSTRARMQRVHE